MLGPGITTASPSHPHMTTPGMIDYILWINQQTNDVAFSRDLQAACDLFEKYHVYQYEKTSSGQLVRKVVDWNLLKIFAQNAARNLNGQRRFLLEFQEYVKQLHYTSEVLKLEPEEKEEEHAEDDAPPIKMPVNQKIARLCGFQEYNLTEFDKVKQLVYQDKATEEEKWRFFCYQYLEMFNILWVDENFIGEWGKDAVFPQRKLFLALLRPEEHLEKTGEAQRDNHIVQVQITRDILRSLGFAGIWDTNHIFTKEQMMIRLIDTKFTKEHENCRTVFSMPKLVSSTGALDFKSLVLALATVFRRCGIKLCSKRGKQKGSQASYTYRLDSESVEKMLELSQMHVNRKNNDGRILCVPEVDELLYRPLVHYRKYTIPRVASNDNVKFRFLE